MALEHLKVNTDISLMIFKKECKMKLKEQQSVSQ